MCALLLRVIVKNKEMLENGTVRICYETRKMILNLVFPLAIPNGENIKAQQKIATKILANKDINQRIIDCC